MPVIQLYLLGNFTKLMKNIHFKNAHDNQTTHIYIHILYIFVEHFITIYLLLTSPHIHFKNDNPQL